MRLISIFILIILFVSCLGDEKKFDENDGHAVIIIAPFQDDNDTINDFDEIENLMNSEAMIALALKNLQRSDHRDSIQKIQEFLSSAILKNNGRLAVKYYTDDANFSVRFLDELARICLERDYQLKTAAADSSIAFIEKQLDTIRKHLEEMSAEIKNTPANNIIDLVREEDKFFNKMISYDVNIRLLQQVIISLDDDIKASIMLSGTNAEFDKELQKELNDYYVLWKKYQEDLTQHKASETQKKAIAKQKKELISLLEIRISEYKKERDKIAANLKTLPRTERDIRNLQRQYDINEKMYTFLLEKKTVLSIKKAGYHPGAIVEQKAVYVKLKK